MSAIVKSRKAARPSGGVFEGEDEFPLANASTTMVFRATEQPGGNEDSVRARCVQVPEGAVAQSTTLDCRAARKSTRAEIGEPWLTRSGTRGLAVRWPDDLQRSKSNDEADISTH
jgi:hypothetical protein